MEERIERDLIKQKTSIIVMICIVVMIGMIGFTYSFFAAEISNGTSIFGEVATPELNITVQKVAPTSTNANKNLIPQLDSAITKAVLGTQGKCVDDNTNAVCQVYKVTLKNVGASSIYVDGVVELDTANNSNLKWARISGDGTNSVEPTVIDGIREAEVTTLTTNELYAAGETKYYYIVVWISETGFAQYDSGRFTGTVRFNNHSETESSPTTAPETLAYLRSLGFEGTVSETEPTTLLTGATTDEGLFAKEDDQGTSYYFRGAVTNNYVKFGKYTEDAYAIYDFTTGTSSYASSCGEATDCTQIASAGDDMYWRIIRINGDGTVRMIYDGTSPHANNVSSTNRQIGISDYNKNYNDNAYVGYMYGKIGEDSTYAETHENITDSSIKTTIDRWYLKYLNSSYGGYIANAIYCNDRSLDTTSTSYTGIGTTTSFYEAYQRLYQNRSTSVNPSLKCEQVNDRFTLQGEEIETTDELGGNQDLTYPVGLITADETVLAGGASTSNSNYYLYTGNMYWTGSASYFYNGNAISFIVYSNGSAPNYYAVHSGVGARAVISIKPDVIKFGDGTADNPFSLDDPATSTLTRLRSLGFEGTVSETEPSTLLTGAATDEGLFAKEDDQGTSYYFRGNVTNNYVKFGKYTEDAYAIYDSTTGTSSYANSCGDATDCTQIASANNDMYWRIVRINGDGTIRMIYDGISAQTSGLSPLTRRIGKSVFNNSNNDNAYVGYMYGQTNASTYSVTHENTNDSAIKTTIDRWYSKYLYPTYYETYISNAIYCNDRKIVTDSSLYESYFGTTSGTGAGTSKTLYGAWNRMELIEEEYGLLSNPTLKCEQKNDRFTLRSEEIETTDGLGGNQKLEYPVGLITVDEMVLAGGVIFNGMDSIPHYLFSGADYWTSSAELYSSSYANVFTVKGEFNGLVISSGVSDSYNVRPVISLKADTLKYGTGEATNPFRIEQ